VTTALVIRGSLVVPESLLRKRDKIVSLLKKLSPPQSTIDLVAEADCLIASHGFVHINDLPRAKVCGSKKAAKEVRRLGQLVNNLRRHIKTMHETAIEAVDRHAKRHVLLIEDDMERLERAAEIAVKAIESAPPSGDVMGPPEKKAAKQLTTVAAVVFRRVSGRPATDPKFFPFLAALFAILGERASAQSQVRLMELSRQEKCT
jgi:hypothetical protein